MSPPSGIRFSTLSAGASSQAQRMPCGAAMPPPIQRLMNTWWRSRFTHASRGWPQRSTNATGEATSCDSSRFRLRCIFQRRVSAPSPELRYDE